VTVFIISIIYCVNRTKVHEINKKNTKKRRKKQKTHKTYNMLLSKLNKTRKVGNHDALQLEGRLTSCQSFCWPCSTAHLCYLACQAPQFVPEPPFIS